MHDFFIYIFYIFFQFSRRPFPPLVSLTLLLMLRLAFTALFCKKTHIGAPKYAFSGLVLFCSLTKSATSPL